MKREQIVRIVSIDNNTITFDDGTLIVPPGSAEVTFGTTGIRVSFPGTIECYPLEWNQAMFENFRQRIVDQHRHSRRLLGYNKGKPCL